MTSSSADHVGYIRKQMKAGCRFFCGLLSFVLCKMLPYGLRRAERNRRFVIMVYESDQGLEYHIKVNADMIGKYVIMPGILSGVRL